MLEFVDQVIAPPPNSGQSAPSITGTAGADSLKGTGANESISGLAGNDSLDGVGGSDTLDGGSGNDSYWATLSDTSALGLSTVVDSSGIDRLVLTAAFPSGGDLEWQLMRINQGNDLAFGYFSPSQGTVVRGVVLKDQYAFNPSSGFGNTVNSLNLTGAVLDGQSMVFRLTASGSDAKSIVGSGWNDMLFGYEGGNTLQGGGGTDVLGAGRQDASSTPLGQRVGDRLLGQAGDDYLYGRQGNDSLLGGSGDDLLYGHMGNDWLDGGPGSDRAEFRGAFSNYRVTYDARTQILTLQDLRGISDPDFTGTDTVRGVEEFGFEGLGGQVVTKTLVELVTATGQNYGVDLNGSAEAALMAESWTGPNQYFGNTSDPSGLGYTRSGVLNAWSAEVGLAGGIKALRLSYLAQDQADLQGLNLQWNLGWGVMGWAQGQHQLALGSSSQPVVYQDAGVTLTAQTVSRTEGGQTWYDLLVSAPSVVSNEVMTQALKNVRIGYAAGTQPERDEATLALKVAISADGQSWVGAQPGQADTLRANFDNSGPIAAVATYKGSVLGIGFKDVDGLPTNLPGYDEYLSWRGQPDREDFVVRIDGRAVVVRAVKFEESGVVLQLAQDLPASGATITVSYVDPAGDDVRQVLQDWQGNDVPSFTLTARPAIELDARASVAAGATLGYGIFNGEGSDRYVGDGEAAYIQPESVATVVSANAQTAVMEAFGGAWDVNPNFDASASAGTLESYRYVREKVVITVPQVAGSPLAVGATLTLGQMINFNQGRTFTAWSDHLLLSQDTSAAPASATALDLMTINLDAPVPMWLIATGHLLGAKAVTVSGGVGPDELNAYGQTVTLAGAAGDDVYTVDITGTGMQTVIDDGSGSADQLKFTVARDLRFMPEAERVGSDLVLRFIDEPSRQTTDTVTVRGVFGANGAPGSGLIETITLTRDDSDVALSLRMSPSPDGIWTHDLLVGDAANDSLVGAGGDDLLFGAGGNDTLLGGEGSDALYLGAGNDELQGGSGTDSYHWNPQLAGAHRIIDSSRAGGFDELILDIPSFNLDANFVGQDLVLSVSRAGQAHASVTLVDFKGASTVRSLSDGADSGTYVHARVATPGADWLVGELGADTLRGDEGNDLLMGSGGADRLEGGPGHDRLFGGAGVDTLVGGAGDDIYVVTDAGDVIIELQADNTLSQKAFSMGNANDAVIATVSYTLAAGVAVEDLMASGTQLTGDLVDLPIDLTGNEVAQGLVGNDAANRLRGMDGDDAMVGLGGNDTLDGGLGNDVFFSGLGDDLIVGDQGDDKVFAFAGQDTGYNTFGAPGMLTVTGGHDTASGGAGTDTIVVDGPRSNYQITRLNFDDYLIRSKSDPTETLKFSGFERVSFGRLTFDKPSQLNPEVLDPSTLPIGGDNPIRMNYWKSNALAVSNTNIDTAVGLNDAIGILKMIVGLNVNGNNQPLSPYQSMAADFNRSGSVDLSDAIDILKHVVGLPSSAPAWTFYDAAKVPATIPDAGILAPALWSAAAKLADLQTVPSGVNVVGVLSGDVDGSWTGA